MVEWIVSSNNVAKIFMYFTSHRIEPKIGSAACHRIGESIQNCEVNRPIPKETNDLLVNCFDDKPPTGKETKQ